MPEPENFYNDGMGWVCHSCERELASPNPDHSALSRAFREGESESKTPVLANRALAKWTDKTRQTLMCPRCGLKETV